MKSVWDLHRFLQEVTESCQSADIRCINYETYNKHKVISKAPPGNFDCSAKDLACTNIWY